MLRLCKLTTGIIVLLFTTGSWAQDVTGRYRLDAAQDPGATDCVWTGTLQLTQSGGNPGTFSGPGSVRLVSGSGCVDFAGTATGTINGSTLDFGIGAGPLGTIIFNGTLAMDGSISGAWAGLGVTGTWSATPVSASSIPVLPIPALLLLITAIAAAGALRLRS